MATYNSKAKLDSKGFDYKDDVFVALSEPILISNKTEFRIFVKTAENGSHNGLFSQRGGFITDIKFGGEKVKNQFSYNFEGLSKSASYKSPLIQEVSELSSEANGTYSGEFGNVISFQDMDGNDFRGLVWSARSIFHTDNTYVAFSVSPKAGEIIRVDSVSLSLGVRSFINQTILSFSFFIMILLRKNCLRFRN